MKKPTVTKKQANKMFRQLMRNIEADNLVAFDIGENLTSIRDTKAYEHLGFANFALFIDSLPMSRSWVYDRMRIHRNFVVRLGIPRKELARLSIGKADMIADIVTPDNYKDWIARCERATEREIRAMVNEYLGRPGVEPRKVKTFLILPEEEPVVDSAIYQMQQKFGGSIGYAFVKMCEMVLKRKQAS